MVRDEAASDAPDALGAVDVARAPGDFDDPGGASGAVEAELVAVEVVE